MKGKNNIGSVDSSFFRRLEKKTRIELYYREPQGDRHPSPA